MANSKLLKEAIADAKAVKETAVQNAKIALEEAFTPKLQSLISQKLQSEMEEEDYEDDFMEDEMDENVSSSKIGKGKGKADSGTDNKQPSGETNTPHTELDPETDHNASAVGHEDDNTEKVKDLDEAESGHELPDPYDAEYETPEEEKETGVYEEEDYEDDDYMDDDDLDLESVISELEAELDMDDEEDYDDEDEIEFEDEDDVEVEIEPEFDEEDDDEYDLEEILREMGYEDEDDDMSEMEHEEEFDIDEVLKEMGYEDEEEIDEDTQELETALEAAYDTIRELKGTINEVNLLNAKLLYANKLFRGYELTNEQKNKVIESFDRTGTVREVKLIYATIAESMKYNGGVRKKKVRNITEGMASKPAGKSTAPAKDANIITEGNELANRFQQLAGINKKED